MIKYFPAEDIREMAGIVSDVLEWKHIKKEQVLCFRSIGTSSKSVIARCHALSKIWQKGLNVDTHYIVEVVSERFDKMSQKEKEMVIIHELMHIPKAFGGGLIPHKGHINRRKVEELHNLFCEKKSENKTESKKEEWVNFS